MILTVCSYSWDLGNYIDKIWELATTKISTEATKSSFHICSDGSFSGTWFLFCASWKRMSTKTHNYWEATNFSTTWYKGSHSQDKQLLAQHLKQLDAISQFSKGSEPYKTINNGQDHTKFRKFSPSCKTNPRAIYMGGGELKTALKTALLLQGVMHLLPQTLLNTHYRWE